MSRKTFLKSVKRIVVKVGTTSLTEGGLISESKIRMLVDDIAGLCEKGYQIALVSSGAISAGAAAMGRKKNNLTIPEKQALASIGQSLLMNEYRKQFGRKSLHAGQILLTEDDVKNRKRFLNARNTFESLFEMGVIPIVNENDTVAVNEIKFGDNDTLSAHIASVIDAHLLVLLSDIDGFYRDLSDPSPLEHVNKITPEILKSAGDSGSGHGTGGMITKLKAADMILKCGEMMIIARGAERNILGRIMAGENTGTLFAGENARIPSRKKWIALRKSRGEVIIDSGASEALISRKKSLLASGITAVNGSFDMGVAVEILESSGKAIGRGIVNYSSTELDTIKGKSTREIKEILGSKYFEEAVNRDYMVVYNTDDKAAD